MLKSKIEIRQFAIEQAVAILGSGTPQKDVVAKAKDIEAYIIGEANLPEVSNDIETISDIMGDVVQMLKDMSDSSPTMGVGMLKEESPKKK